MTLKIIVKKILKLSLFLIIISGICYFILKENGFNLDSILNKSKTYELYAECPKIENLLLTSVTGLRVTNNGGKIHKDVKVRITAYDKNGDIVKQKSVEFFRNLHPYKSFSKVITLPTKTKKCDCVVLDSKIN
jgi:hypothetical protein